MKLPWTKFLRGTLPHSRPSSAAGRDPSSIWPIVSAAIVAAPRRWPRRPFSAPIARLIAGAAKPLFPPGSSPWPPISTVPNSGESRLAWWRSMTLLSHATLAPLMEDSSRKTRIAPCAAPFMRFLRNIEWRYFSSISTTWTSPQPRAASLCRKEPSRRGYRVGAPYFAGSFPGNSLPRFSERRPDERPRTRSHFVQRGGNPSVVWLCCLRHGSRPARSCRSAAHSLSVEARSARPLRRGPRNPLARCRNHPSVHPRRSRAANSAGVACGTRLSRCSFQKLRRSLDPPGAAPEFRFGEARDALRLQPHGALRAHLISFRDGRCLGPKKCQRYTKVAPVTECVPGSWVSLLSLALLCEPLRSLRLCVRFSLSSLLCGLCALCGLCVFL